MAPQEKPKKDNSLGDAVKNVLGLLKITDTVEKKNSTFLDTVKVVNDLALGKEKLQQEQYKTFAQKSQLAAAGLTTPEMHEEEAVRRSKELIGNTSRDIFSTFGNLSGGPSVADLRRNKLDDIVREYKNKTSLKNSSAGGRLLGNLTNVLTLGIGDVGTKVFGNKPSLENTLAFEGFASDVLAKKFGALERQEQIDNERFYNREYQRHLIADNRKYEEERRTDDRKYEDYKISDARENRRNEIIDARLFGIGSLLENREYTEQQRLRALEDKEKTEKERRIYEERQKAISSPTTFAERKYNIEAETVQKAITTRISAELANPNSPLYVMANGDIAENFIKDGSSGLMGAYQTFLTASNDPDDLTTNVTNLMLKQYVNEVAPSDIPSLRKRLTIEFHSLSQNLQNIAKKSDGGVVPGNINESMAVGVSLMYQNKLHEFQKLLDGMFYKRQKIIEEKKLSKRTKENFSNPYFFTLPFYRESEDYSDTRIK